MESYIFEDIIKRSRFVSIIFPCAFNALQTQICLVPLIAKRFPSLKRSHYGALTQWLILRLR
jgi:hypothetical protein